MDHLVSSPTIGVGASPAGLASRSESGGRLSPALSPRLAGLTVCQFSTVQRTVDARAFFRECAPLRAAGLRTRLLAPHGLDGLRDGVELSSLPARKNRFLRMLLAPALLPTLLRQRAHLYHFHDPELIPLGLLLKLIFRRKVVYDCREDFPCMMAHKRYLPAALRPLVGWSLSALEGLAARFLDGVLTADASTMRRFARLGRSRKLVFFNFPNLEFFPEPPSVPKRYDLVYRGGIADRTGTGVLLEALCILRDQGRPTKTLLLGYFDNPRAEQVIRAQMAARGLTDCIDLLSRIDHSHMAAALAQARIGVCPLQAVPKFLRNIPVKVFEYWASGLPVVTSDLPPIRPFFRHADYGLLFKPGDAAALASSIQWLLEHPVDACRMGARGRAAVVERLNNRNEIRKLLAFYSRILE